MGKTKHKKHHRHGDEEEESENGGVGGGGGLKLILKVGSSTSKNKSGEKHKKKKKKKDKKKERDKERKHRHHHKEKRKDPASIIEDASLTSTAAAAAQPEPELAKPMEIEVPKNEVEIENEAVKSEVEIHPDSSKAGKEALTRLLEHMLHHLQKKDVNQFFSMPVNDQFAPGYSAIIKNPMDFSTMRTKLGGYLTLAQFRHDFELICNNAMTYNTVDTIYYKQAKKMLHYGQKLFSHEKLRSMRHHLPFVQLIPDSNLGLDMVVKNEDFNEEDDDDEVGGDVGDVSKVIEDIREVVRRPPGRFEAIPDDLSPAEIVQQAKIAAKCAADKLKLHKPKSRMGFLRQKQDGTTSLNFLPGGSGVVPGTDNDRPVLLGSLIGKVKQGTGTIQGFREDRRNLAKAIHPLYYGAYSSHGPSYDSTFANLTKEETDLVFSTYCDNVGVQYAESILNFSRSCDYAMFIVDHLLDILTGNEHRKTSKYIEQQKMLRKEDELLDSAFKDVHQEVIDLEKDEEEKEEDKGEENEEKDKDKEKEMEVETKEDEKDKEKEEEKKDDSVEKDQKEEKKNIDFESLKSLEEDGIDMSFLETLQKEHSAMEAETEAASSKDLLAANAQLIEQLKQVQSERLSATPPIHFAQISKPGEKEMELVANIQTNLIGITGQLKPEQVVPKEPVRKALNIAAKAVVAVVQPPQQQEEATKENVVVTASADSSSMDVDE